MLRIQELLQKRKKTDLAELIAEMEDLLMREYGWISIGELQKEPIPRMMALLKVITKRYKKEKLEYEKSQMKLSKGRR